jgi:hypothetical protein
MHFKKCDKYVNTSWGADRSEVWPNMAPAVVDDVVEFAERQQYCVPMPSDVEEHEIKEPVKTGGRKKAPPHSNVGSRAATKGVASHGSEGAEVRVQNSRASTAQGKDEETDGVQRDDSDSVSSKWVPENESNRLPQDDPRRRQTWSEYGTVHSGNVLVSGVKRERKKRLVPGYASDWTSDSQGFRLSRKPELLERRRKERQERAAQKALKRSKREYHDT